jgi:hypothetical protein
MSEARERRCIGPCARTLPRTAEHFYRQDGGDGFAPRCRECYKAAARERKAAARERRKFEPPQPKRCVKCERELPGDIEHFSCDTLGRPRPRCRECEAAAPSPPVEAKPPRKPRRDVEVVAKSPVKPPPPPQPDPAPDPQQHAVAYGCHHRDRIYLALRPGRAPGPGKATIPVCPGCGEEHVISAMGRPRSPSESIDICIDGAIDPGPIEPPKEPRKQIQINDAEILAVLTDEPQRAIDLAKQLGYTTGQSVVARCEKLPGAEVVRRANTATLVRRVAA